GKKDVLDLGMPKPLAEVLVFGKCFALNGKPVPASKIAFRVGDIQKSLNVFGNRYWKRSNTFLETISEPEPFTEMDIGWSNAFGGEGFELNPDGKGYVELVNKAGIKYQPLPNILYPNGMMGSSKDKPKPAGIAPMGTGWPCRLKKLGTFDKKWLQENWPGFPNDFDFTYFNLAPEDQRKGDYFFGTEEIEINKMHPERPVIKSHLPGIRTRCFVNKKKENSEVFEELNLKLDTIWLFPHLNMGVCGWRGTTIVVDDESSDVIHLLAFYEKPGETEQPMEFYRSKLLEEEAKAIEPELEEPVVEEEETGKVKIPGIPKVAGVAGVAVAAGVGAEILKAEPEEEEKEEEEKEEVKVPEPEIEDIAALPPGIKKTLNDLKKNYGIDMAAGEQIPGLSKMAPEDALAAVEKQIKQDEKKTDEIFRKFGIDPNQPVKDPEMPENIKKIIEQGELPKDLDTKALEVEVKERIAQGEQQMDALF
ncbi:MAG: DUF2169 domain-containing protein, partial [Candidatus Cloacimonetes bacterium]|nr:DUF2169 domain-containing protein [Candidatus Cloacimonadota bacterium]